MSHISQARMMCVEHSYPFCRVGRQRIGKSRGNLSRSRGEGLKRVTNKESSSKLGGISIRSTLKVTMVDYLRGAE